MNEETLKLFKRLIAEDKLEDLIIILKLINIQENKVIKLSSRLNSLRNRINTQTISDDNSQVEKNKIIKSLLNLIDEFKKNETQIPINSKAKENFKIYLEKFIELTDAKNWYNWTSGIFDAHTTYPFRNQEKLLELIEYINTRAYFSEFPKMEMALKNFAHISHDFIYTFMKHSDVNFDNEGEWDSAILITPKFTDNIGWNSKLYAELSGLHHFHTYLVADLVLEMTRLLNYIYELARENIDSDFHIELGIAHVLIGGIKKDGSYASKFMYRDSEKIDLYPGLSKFMEIRESRTFNLGRGVNGEYLS